MFSSLPISYRDLKPGDTLSVYGGRSFLAKGITMTMKLYVKRLKIDIDPVPHHSAKIILHDGELCVAESLANGPVVLPLLKAYTKSEWRNRIIVHSPKVPFSQQEIEKISDKAETLALEGTPYDQANFIFSFIKAFTGLWLGPKGKNAEYRFYCSELAATLDNYVRSGMHRNPEASNPVDIAINKNYRHKGTGVIWH